MHAQDYLFQISRYFGYFEGHLFYENSSGKFDINKQAETFLKPILDLIFDADFIRLEIEQENHPGVDLGDKTKKIAFQITSQIGYAKIKKTLEKVIQHKLFEEYDEFYHLVIDRDYKTGKTQQDVDEFITETIAKEGLPTETSVSFHLDTHLWNLKKLRAKIEQHCSTEQLQQIVALLKKNYGPVTELPTFKEVLVPYRVTFEKQLTPTAQLANYQFYNDFFGRTDTLSELKKFAESPGQQLAIVTAPGGTGKTRSCIEFFKQQVDPDQNNISFTLNEVHFDVERLREALKTEKTVFILVDDADRMKHVLSPLMDQVQRFANAKVIFTTRDSTYSEVINSLPSHLRDHKRIPLERLGYQETKDLLSSQLLGIDEQFIIGLAQKSNGVPLVILALCDLVRKGASIDSITENIAFGNHVKLVTDQAIANCNDATHISPSSISKVIAVLAFLGPVAYNDEEVTILSSLAGVSIDDTLVIIDNLRQESFLAQSDQQCAIKPDPYADSILLTNAARIKYWLRSQGLEPFKERIIKNIIQVSDSPNSKFDIAMLMDDFVFYLVGLAKKKEYKKLVSGLETIESFTYKKTDIANHAVEMVLANLPKNDEDPDLEFWFTVKRIQDVHQKINTILSISTLNSHGEQKLNKALELIMALYETSRDTKNLTSPFRYRVFDFLEFGYQPNIVCERQQFLALVLQKRASVEVLEADEQEIILAFSKGLLSTEFSMEDFFESQTGRFSYGLAEVPSNSIIEKIRNDIYQLLTNNFEKFNSVNQGEIMAMLIQKVSHIRKDLPRLGHRYEQSKELAEWLPFISGQIATERFPQERGKLIRTVQIAESFGIKEEFKEDVEKLKLLLYTSADLAGRLRTFLNYDHRLMEKEMNKEVTELIAQSASPADFFEMMEQVRKDVGIFEAQNLQSVLNELVLNHPAVAGEFLDYAISHFENPHFYSILSKAIYQDQKKFQQHLDYFWNKRDHASRSAAVWMLTSGRERNKEYYEKDDLAYFESVIDDRNTAAIQTLSYNLPEFLSIAPESVLNMVHRIIGSEVNYNDHGILIRRLFDKENTEGVDPQVLKKFLKEKTDDLTLDHDFDQSIRYLEENFGFDEVISFLAHKFEQASKSDGSPASYLGYYYPGTETTEPERVDRFIKVITKFLDQDIQTYKELVKLFRPYEGFSPDLEKGLHALTATLSGEKAKLLSLMELLKVIEPVNSTYLNFAANIGNILEESMGANQAELEAIFPSNILYNTGARSKSVSALVFPEDERRLKIIKKLLENKQLKPKLKSVIENILLRIEQSMKETEAETMARLQQHQ